MEESGSGAEAGSVPINYGSGCGSGRPKNIRILRIRNTARKDPERRSTHLGLIQIPNHRWYLVDSGRRLARTKQQGRRKAAKRASWPLREEAVAALTPSHLEQGCHSPAAQGPVAAAAGPPRRPECGCRSAWERAAGQG
jgi:hypothetical protein